MEENRDRLQERVSPVPLDDFLSQGLMEAQSLLVLDLEKCTRCDECVRACADAHDGVTRLIRDGLRFDKYLVATLVPVVPRPALHGRLPGRLDPAPADSLRDHHRGLVHRLRPVRQQCPYGNINMHPFKVVAEDPEHPGG